MFKNCIVEPITPPTFAVVDYAHGIYVVLNEYELRQLILAVAKGEWVGYRFGVEDNEGCRAVIEDDGRLTQALKGLRVAGDYTLKLIQLRREQEANQPKNIKK